MIVVCHGVSYCHAELPCQETSSTARSREFFSLDISFHRTTWKVICRRVQMTAVTEQHPSLPGFRRLFGIGSRIRWLARLKVFFPGRHSISRFRTGATTLVRSGDTTHLIGWQCGTASSSCNGMALTKHLLFELASDRWC